MWSDGHLDTQVGREEAADTATTDPVGLHHVEGVAVFVGGGSQRGIDRLRPVTPYLCRARRAFGSGRVARLSCRGGRGGHVPSPCRCVGRAPSRSTTSIWRWSPTSWYASTVTPGTVCLTSRPSGERSGPEHTSTGGRPSDDTRPAASVSSRTRCSWVLMSSWSTEPVSVTSKCDPISASNSGSMVITETTPSVASALEIAGPSAARAASTNASGERLVRARSPDGFDDADEVADRDPVVEHRGEHALDIGRADTRCTEVLDDRRIGRVQPLEQTLHVGAGQQSAGASSNELGEVGHDQARSGRPPCCRSPRPRPGTRSAPSGRGVRTPAR